MYSPTLGRFLQTDRIGTLRLGFQKKIGTGRLKKTTNAADSFQERKRELVGQVPQSETPPEWPDARRRDCCCPTAP